MTNRPADPADSSFAVRRPKAYLALHLVAGVLFTAALLWGFAAIADAVGDNGRLVRGDASLTAWIQQHDTEWGETLFNGISWLGSAGVAVLVTIVTVSYGMRRQWRHASLLAFGYLSAAGLNQLLKQLFHRGRPEFATEFIKHASWSFPSGHAMDSLVGYGLLLFLALEHVHAKGRRRLTLGAGVILIVLIGISRVYLGVHYLSDVVAGWLAGGAWLFVCVSAYELARRENTIPWRAAASS